MTTAAVLGTGTMGAPMARNLARVGLAVRAWNRSADKAAALAADGIAVCQSAEDAVAGADVVVTVLLDAEAVAGVMTGVLPAMADEALWLQMSTVGLAGTERLAAMAGHRGVGFVDAPVLGTKQPAEKGELVVVASGPSALRERAAVVFDAVGKQTRWVGDEPGAASALKLAVNAWVLAVNDAVSESLALAAGLGLDPQAFLDAIAGGPTDSPYAHLKAKLIASGDYPPSFALSAALKDAGLVLEAAERAGLRLGVAEAVRADLARAAAVGHGGEDMAAVHHAHLPG